MPPIRLRYQTIEFGTTDIHLRSLRDICEYSDDECLAEALGISSANWSLFGVLWASGEALARIMVDFDVSGKRILEVGCGIGLPSLVLNHRGANITATDYHPEAEKFLKANVDLNGDKAIPFVRTGWRDEENALGTFDVIIGSDLLYEPGQSESLSNFIDQHANPTCAVMIVDPRRGQRGRFSREMMKLGYSCSRTTAGRGTDPMRPFDGQLLSYLRSR